MVQWWQSVGSPWAAAYCPSYREHLLSDGSSVFDRSRFTLVAKHSP